MLISAVPCHLETWDKDQFPSSWMNNRDRATTLCWTIGLFFLFFIRGNGKIYIYLYIYINIHASLSAYLSIMRFHKLLTRFFFSIYLFIDLIHLIVVHFARSHFANYNPIYGECLWYLQFTHVNCSINIYRTTIIIECGALFWQFILLEHIMWLRVGIVSVSVGVSVCIRYRFIRHLYYVLLILVKEWTKDNNQSKKKKLHTFIASEVCRKYCYNSLENSACEDKI